MKNYGRILLAKSLLILSFLKKITTIAIIAVLKSKPINDYIKKNDEII